LNSLAPSCPSPFERVRSNLADALALTRISRTDLGYLSDDRRKFCTCAYSLPVVDAKKRRHLPGVHAAFSKGARAMSIRDEQITDTTITRPVEQRASGAFSMSASQEPPSHLSQIGHFVWHFVQMCLACCIGGFILCFLFFGSAALIGYPNLIQQAPSLSTLVIAIFVAVPMAAWMRFRGMEWRPTLEMAAAPIVLGVLLITLAWLGIVPKSNLIEWLTRLACPAMLIPMLLRIDLYTGRKGHLAHAS
jgi:hypothetical protein